MYQTYYHMVMWSGTELWIMYQTLPYGHVDRGWDTEVTEVDYVPDILPYGHVEWYRGCGLCTRHITIWSCGVVQRLWIMYQTLPYGHVEWYRGVDTEVV